MTFKKIFFIALMAISSITTINAQSLGVGMFSLPENLWDPSTNTFLINRDAETETFAIVGIYRNNLPEWTSAGLEFNIEVEVFATNNETSESIKISDSITFVTSDFIGTTGVTQVKYPNLTIPENFITEEGGAMVVRFRYYKENYPIPDNIDGWTEWYTTPTEINLRLEDPILPGTIISGPSEFCNSGVYTLTNPGVVTLLSASGIASLTDLGNNQWQITRTGTAGGFVTLRSTVGQTNYDQIIAVGDIMPTEILGNNILNTGSHRFNISAPSGISVQWSVSSGTNNVTLVNSTSNSTNVQVDNWDFYGLNQIILTARITGTCGTTLILTRTLGAGPGGAIEET